MRSPPQKKKTSPFKFKLAQVISILTFSAWQAFQRAVVLVLYCAIVIFSGLFIGDAAKRGRQYLREAGSGSDTAPEPAASSTDIPRRIGGGKLQRARERAEEEAAARAAEPPQIKPDGPLTADLKRRWAKGKLTSDGGPVLNVEC